MKKTLPLLFILFSSCAKYVQIFKTEPATPGITSAERLYFENDTVKITYSFWQKDGTIAYSILNKLNTPIYIDWKKSSYVGNGVKADYWVDETITKTTGYHSSNTFTGYGYYGLLGVSSTVSSFSSRSLKPERITFIAPHSNYIGSKFTLFPRGDNKLKTDASTGAILNPITHKEVSITYEEFSKENTPLSFRNFLTISMTEDFGKEYYIDNGFYVSKISEMNKSVFLGRANQDHGKAFEMPFKAPSLFYIEVK